MVAQTKGIARHAANKASTAGKRFLKPEDIAAAKEAAADQVAAAAVVDVDQVETEAVAAAETFDAGLILPTEAPVGPSIVELAQAAPPAATSTDTTPATTPAPAAEEAAAATQLSPWAVGGIALVGVGAVAAAAGGSSDSPAPPPPPPAEEPAPTPAPTPAPSAPVAENGTTEVPLDASTAIGAKIAETYSDADNDVAKIKITGINVALDNGIANLVYNEATGKAYLLATGAADWDAAKAAAESAGGYLAILNDQAEAEFLANSSLVALFGDDSGNDGTYVGLSQAMDATQPDEGWKWIDDTPIDGTSALWNDHDYGVPGLTIPWDNDGDETDHANQYGAIYDGSVSSEPWKILYDANGTMPSGKYLIEFDNATSGLFLNGAAVQIGQEISVADLANLSWNSVFNTGGTITYTVIDATNLESGAATLTITEAASSYAPPTTIASLIDDQPLGA